MTHVINNVLIGLNNLGRVFCNYAASVFVQSALLVILLLVVDLLLRKRVRAVFRYCLWMLVLVKLVLPPMFSLPTGIGYWVGDRFPAAFPISSQAFDVAGLERASPSSEMPQVRPAQNITEIDALTAPAASALTPLTWQAVLFILWLVGVFAFLVVLVQRIKFVRGLVAASSPAKKELLGLLEQCRRQIGIRVDIRLRVSETIPSPAVCGFFRPTVLIPTPLVEKLSPEGLRATLIHELAHIKRGDLWVNSVQTFLQVVYFYNPFVWFANSVIRRICEEAVDEMVLVTLGGQAKDYSNTLIDIGEMAFWRADLGLRLIGVAESKKVLKWRIKHMLTRPIPKSSKLGALGIVVIFTIAAVLLPMAKAEKSNEDNKPVTTENERTPTKSLHQAAADGDIGRVRSLISQGFDVNEEDEDHETPLYFASKHGHKDIAEILIAEGADVNARNGCGETPLFHSVVRGHKYVAELLIAEGADVNARDMWGETILEAACWSGNGDVAELLVAKGADVDAKDMWGYTPLYYATWSRWDRDTVKLLVDRGADVNFVREGGYPYLKCAITKTRRNLDIVKLLVAHGAKLDVKDKDGWTAFHYAAVQGKRNIIRFFVSEGADVSTFHKAASVGHINRVKLFVQQGADVDEKDELGWTPLFFAASLGRTEVAEFLIDNGSDIHAKINDGRTALHQALQVGAAELAELLIAKGADVNAKTSEGQTPLHQAVRTGYGRDPAVIAVIEVLIAKGADVNAKDENGCTPLHLLAMKGHTNTAELLLAKGADVNAKNKYGYTPLRFALWPDYASKEFIELLRKHGAKE